MIIGLSISLFAFISAAIIKIYNSTVEPKVDSIAPSVTRYDSVGSNDDTNDLEAEAEEASIKADQSKEEADNAVFNNSDNAAELIEQAEAARAEADRIEAVKNLAEANSDIADLERRLSEAMDALEANDLTSADKEARIRESISSYKTKALKATEEAEDLKETTTYFDKRIAALTIAIKSLEIAKIEYYHLENLTQPSGTTATLIKNIADEILNLQNTITKIRLTKRKYQLWPCSQLEATNPVICKNRIDCLHTPNKDCEELVCDTMPVDENCSNQAGCRIGSKERCLRERKSCSRYNDETECEDMGCTAKYTRDRRYPDKGRFNKCEGVSKKPMPACTTKTNSNGEFAGCDGSNEWGDCVGGNFMTWCIDNK